MTNDELYGEYMKLHIAHSIACDLYHHAREEKREEVWPLVQNVRQQIRELKRSANLPLVDVYLDSPIDGPVILSRHLLQLSDGKAYAWHDINLYPLKFYDTWTWQLDFSSDAV